MTSAAESAARAVARRGYEERNAASGQRLRQPGRFHALDALRGYAALAVVFFHCMMTYYPTTRPVWLMMTPLRLFVAGPSAVFVFFALSGFVLFLAFGDDERVSYAPFIVKRFLRLYPPFVAAILGSAVLWLCVQPHPIPALSAWFNGSWSIAPTLKVLLGHLAMTDRPALHSLDNVMWSLCIEARISPIFPLVALWVKRNWAIALVASTALSVALSATNVSEYPWVVNPFSTLQYLVLFVGGAALALNAGDIRDLLSTLPGWETGFAWLAALTALSFTPNPHFFLISDIAALCVIALCFGDRRAAPVFLNPIAAWLGRISYSLYLIHLPLVLTFVHVLWGRLPLGVILLCAVGVSLAAAEISYRFVEEPSIRLARRLVAQLARAAHERPLAIGSISKAVDEAAQARS